MAELDRAVSDMQAAQRWQQWLSRQVDRDTRREGTPFEALGTEAAAECYAFTRTVTDMGNFAAGRAILRRGSTTTHGITIGQISLEGFQPFRRYDVESRHARAVGASASLLLICSDNTLRSWHGYPARGEEKLAGIPVVHEEGRRSLAPVQFGYRSTKESPVYRSLPSQVINGDSRNGYDHFRKEQVGTYHPFCEEGLVTSLTQQVMALQATGQVRPAFDPWRKG